MRLKLSKMPMADYLEEKSEKSSDGCINWMGAVHPKGHGKFNLKGKQMRPHRVAYELAYGPVTKGMLVCHRCDNPRCINPAHLFVGTISDNNADMVAKNRHAFGSKNGAAKLTDWRVCVVRKAALCGIGVSDIARRLGMSQATISSAVSGKTWKHVRTPEAHKEASDGTA